MSFSWFKAKVHIQSEDNFLWFLMYRTTGVSCLLRAKAYPRSNLAKLISGIGPLTIPVTQIISLKGTAKSKENMFFCGAWKVSRFHWSFNPVRLYAIWWDFLVFHIQPSEITWTKNCLAKIHDLHEPSPFGLQNTICNVVPSRSCPSLS